MVVYKQDECDEAHQFLLHNLLHAIIVLLFLIIVVHRDVHIKLDGSDAYNCDMP